MSKDVNLRVAAKAVIERDGRVLIVREAATYKDGNKIGQYGLIGGRIESHESFYDALNREVMEEVGLEIEPISPIHVGEWWPKIKDQKNHIVAVFMHCKGKSGDVKLSEEHDDYCRVDLEEIGKKDLMEPDRTVAINFLESLSNTSK